MQERRQSIRIGKSLFISLRNTDQLLGMEARSTDISAGGVCFPISRKLEVHNVLELTFKLSEDSAPLKVVGEVMWVRERDDPKLPFEAGVKFVKIGSYAHDRILHFLSKHGSPDVKWID